MTRKTRALLALLPALFAGCNFGVPDISASEVPDHPVYWTDVLPLFEDHCTLCHGHPSNYGAPSDFRLDRYASARAESHNVWEQISEDGMPPAASWGDGMGPNGKKLIRLWVEQGAPECNLATDCPDSGQTCTAQHLCTPAH
jgi:hypothetical protein